MFSATAARDAALTGTVSGLPPFMAQLRTTLTTLNVTLGISKPTLAVIKGSAPLVRPALSEVVQLSQPALSLLRQAPSLVNLTIKALPWITRFTVAFNTTLQPLLSAARQVVPVINFIELFPKDVLAGFANLAADINARAPASNGNTEYIRSALTLNNEGLFGQPSRPSTNRHNPYVSPGGLANVASGGLLSSDCNNLGNTGVISDLDDGERPVPAAGCVSVAFERGVERPELLPAAEAVQAVGHYIRKTP